MNYTQAIQINTLAQRRKIFGLTQQQVADALTMTSSDRISHWEKGKAIPNLVNLFRICALYKCLPHELYPVLLVKTQENSLSV
ncbi:MAG: helix-turn-helix protein [Bacteroidota bacterium]|jgi:transcriptional regulator with XRE-family HTH domain